MDLIKEFDILYNTIYGKPPGDGEVVYSGTQIKGEFIQAWNLISSRINDTPHTFTFLEIGAYKGLWPLMLSFICNKLNKSFEYTTVTWLDQDINNKDIFKVIDYFKTKDHIFNLINENSQTLDVSQLKNQYDLVFIDADHRYEGILKDIKKYSSLASQILMFHDIRPKIETPGCGVYKALKHEKITLDEEITYNPNIMGIGLKYIK